jgi:hypothetical protein
MNAYPVTNSFLCRKIDAPAVSPQAENLAKPWRRRVFHGGTAGFAMRVHHFLLTKISAHGLIKTKMF